MTLELASHNPATGERLGSVMAAAPEEVGDVVRRARAAQAAWGAKSIRERARALQGLNDAIVRRADDIAALIMAEQGKGAVEAYGEVFAALDQLRYYRRAAPHVLRERRVWPRLGWLRAHRLQYCPYGVVGVISPWNYPFTLSLEPMLAALMAGNACVLKPSECVPLIGEKIKHLLAESGLPGGLAQVVQGDGAVGAALIGAGIQKLVFTGSVATGRKVAALAGQHLVPVTLELGGKDAAIVLAEADLERAAQGITWGANLNAGQACLAVERVYVAEAVADEFIRRVVEQFRALRVGPGSAAEVEITAITTPAQLEIVAAHVAEAVAGGARVEVGGRPRPGPGRFFEPTVLTGVAESMRVMTDETFGPLIAIQRVRDADEAVRLANASRYGLTASVWTRDLALGRRLAARLEAGDVAVNEHGAPAGHAEIPWGGVKDSGYGRTRGPEGLRAMTTVRHVSWPRFQTRREAFWFPNSLKTVRAVRQGIAVLFGTWADKWAALTGKF